MNRLRNWLWKSSASGKRVAQLEFDIQLLDRELADLQEGMSTAAGILQKQAATNEILIDSIGKLRDQNVYQAKQLQTVAALLGITFLTPKELQEREDALAKQTTLTTMGEMTVEEVEAHMAASGLSKEEWADQFCACEQHTAQRAAKDLGLPE